MDIPFHGTVYENIRDHSMKLYKEMVNSNVLLYSFGNRVIDQ